MSYFPSFGTVGQTCGGLEAAKNPAGLIVPGDCRTAEVIEVNSIFNDEFRVPAWKVSGLRLT
ncbi:MAG: hypothetical protein K0A93_08805 [Desulfuromonadaceae bacterium]|nr:hypothetical protein [Desulfuromonadaceae bacterium]